MSLGAATHVPQCYGLAAASTTHVPQCLIFPRRKRTAVGVPCSRRDVVLLHNIVLPCAQRRPSGEDECAGWLLAALESSPTANLRRRSRFLSTYNCNFRRRSPVLTPYVLCLVGTYFYSEVPYCSWLEPSIPLWTSRSSSQEPFCLPLHHPSAGMPSRRRL